MYVSYRYNIVRLSRLATQLFKNPNVPIHVLGNVKNIEICKENYSILLLITDRMWSLENRKPISVRRITSHKKNGKTRKNTQKLWKNGSQNDLISLFLRRKETITLCVSRVCARVQRRRFARLDDKKYGKRAETRFAVCVTTFAERAALVRYWKSRRRIEFSVTTRSHDRTQQWYHLILPLPPNAPFFPVVVEFERYISFEGFREQNVCGDKI